MLDSLRGNESTIFITNLIEGVAKSGEEVDELEDEGPLLPPTRPWFISPRHYLFLTQYFHEDRVYNPRWMQAYWGYTPSKQPSAPEGTARMSDEPPEGISLSQIALRWRANTFILAFQVHTTVTTTSAC